MIESKHYEEMQKIIQDCQAFDMPCVLIYLNKPKEDVDGLFYYSAVNSSYEMLGMIKRAERISNVNFSIITEGEENVPND